MDGRLERTIGASSHAPEIAALQGQIVRKMRRFCGTPLYVTTRLRSERTLEQVFVHVRAWPQPDQVEGTLASRVSISGYQQGQGLTVTTADVLDWTISWADGTEEGNRLGRFLDQQQR